MKFGNQMRVRLITRILFVNLYPFISCIITGWAKTRPRRFRNLTRLAAAILDGIEVLHRMIQTVPDLSRILKQEPIHGLLSAFLTMTPESRQIALTLLNPFNEAILTFLGGVEVLNKQDYDRTERRFLDYVEREQHRPNSRQSEAGEGSSQSAPELTASGSGSGMTSTAHHAQRSSQFISFLLCS